LALKRLKRTQNVNDRKTRYWFYAERTVTASGKMDEVSRSFTCFEPFVKMLRLTTVPSTAEGNRMFLGMQDFDFCPNLIKFNQICPNFTQFI